VLVGVVVVVVVGLARDRVLELAHARAELAPQAGQALRPEDQQHDPEHDQKLEGTDGFEDGEAHTTVPTRDQA